MRDTCHDTQRDVEVLPIGQDAVKTVSDALGHKEADSLVNKFAATLLKMEAKTTDGRLRDVEGKALVDRTACTHPEVKVRMMSTY